jgi:hypothetical protein
MSHDEDRSERFFSELKAVRDTTKNLIDSVLWDIWPHNATIIDFGLDSQEHYEALYYPIREFEVMPKELDAALGHGEKLTNLTRNAASNPHKNIQFYTSWDGIYNRPRSEGALSEEAKLQRILGSFSTAKITDFDDQLQEAAKRGEKEYGADKDDDIER